MAKQAIGVSGVISMIGLLAENDCCEVDEDVLIEALCKRFETTPVMAVMAIDNTINFGAVARVHMGDAQDVVRVVRNPDNYAPEVTRVRRDVWLRELGGRFGVTKRQAARIIKSAVDAGVLEETVADGKKLLRFKK